MENNKELWIYKVFSILFINKLIKIINVVFNKL